jgi:hypothetical protein
MVCGYPYHADVAAGSKCYLEVYRRQEMGGRRCTDGDEISAISLVMLSLQQYCIRREQYSSHLCLTRSRGAALHTAVPVRIQS